MTDRRTVLKAGAALTGVAALSALSLAPAASGGSARTPAWPRAVMVDPRFAASRAWGEEQAALGATVIELNRDIADIWLGDLARAASEGAVIAGVTLYSDRMISEVFGREHGMRMSVAAVSGGVELHEWTLTPVATGRSA